MTSFHTWTTVSFGSVSLKWSYTSDHCTGRRPCAIAIDAARPTKWAYPPSAVRLWVFSHDAIEGVFVQQSVFTSSPPRWRKSSGKSPIGFPFADLTPPVHSLRRPVITSKVLSLATLSGVVHVALGQMSGTPKHHDWA